MARNTEKNLAGEDGIDPLENMHPAHSWIHFRPPGSGPPPAGEKPWLPTT
jgi:hypothetical protein